MDCRRTQTGLLYAIGHADNRSLGNCTDICLRWSYSKCTLLYRLLNLIAIVWVPTVSLLYLRFSGIDFGIFEALTKLTLLVALPLFIGQLVRSIFPNLSATLCQKTVWFCPAIILWLVYIAFVRSLLSDSFTQLPAKQVIFTISLSGVLLFLISGLVAWSTRWLRLERERRIAAFYCASQNLWQRGCLLRQPSSPASVRKLCWQSPYGPCWLIIPYNCYWLPESSVITENRLKNPCGSAFR